MRIYCYFGKTGAYYDASCFAPRKMHLRINMQGLQIHQQILKKKWRTNFDF